MLEAIIANIVMWLMGMFSFFNIIKAWQINNSLIYDAPGLLNRNHGGIMPLHFCIFVDGEPKVT